MKKIKVSDEFLNNHSSLFKGSSYSWGMSFKVYRYTTKLEIVKQGGLYIIYLHQYESTPTERNSILLGRLLYESDLNLFLKALNVKHETENQTVQI